MKVSGGQPAKRAIRALTTRDGRADFVSNFDIAFEVWSEFHDLPCKVASDVRTLGWEVLVG